MPQAERQKQILELVNTYQNDLLPVPADMATKEQGGEDYGECRYKTSSLLPFKTSLS
jgi:hypothetical protein